METGCQRRFGPPESALPSGGQGTAIGRQSVNRSGSSSGPMWIQGHPSAAGIIHKKHKLNAESALLSAGSGALRRASFLSAKLLCQKKLPVDTQPPVQKGGVRKTVKEQLSFLWNLSDGVGNNKMSDAWFTD